MEHVVLSEGREMGFCETSSPVSQPQDTACMKSRRAAGGVMGCAMDEFCARRSGGRCGRHQPTVQESRFRSEVLSLTSVFFFLLMLSHS